MVTRRKILIALIVCLFAELFLFQWKAVESRFFPAVPAAEWQFGEGLQSLSLEEMQERGLKFSTRTELAFVVTNPEEAYLFRDDFSADIRNLHINAYSDTPGADVALPLHLTITDEANAIEKQLPSRVIVRDVPESHYIRLHPAGDCTSLRIDFEAEEGTILRMDPLPALNEVRPFMIRPARLLCMAAIATLILMLTHPAHPLAQRLDFKRRGHRAAVLIAMALQALMIVGAGLSTRPDLHWKEWGRHEKQYEEQTEAFLNGQIDLLWEAPEWLNEMDNPYDYISRVVRAGEAQGHYLSDTGYYNGRYYMYFGVVPVITTFLPIRFLTGRIPATWKVMILYAVVYALLMFVFLWKLVQRYFHKRGIGIGAYLLASFTINAATGAVYLAAFPVTFSVPTMTGMLFSLAGLTAWLYAADLMRQEAIEKRTVICYRILLILGGFLIALTLGTRVSFILTTLLAFPVFAEEIKKGLFFRPERGSVTNTACVMVPFLIVCIPLLWYNAVRFGSPVEFGYHYNLTIMDMLHYRITPYRLFKNIWLYLLQPLHITDTYPFIRGVDFQFSFQGDSYIEPQTGSFLAYNLIALAALFTWRLRRRLREKGVFSLSIVSLAIAVCVLVVDALIAGVSHRYQYDFAFYWMLAAVLVLFTLYERVPEVSGAGAEGVAKELSAVRFLYAAVIALCVASIVLNYFSLLSDGRYFEMQYTNPEVFYRIRHLFFAP